MNVADLQLFLKTLAALLGTCGAKKAAEELDRVCAGLAPFRTLSAGQFADFLEKAETYARTGAVPTTGATKAAGAPRAAKAADPERVRTAAQRMLALYEQAPSDQVAYGTIDAEVKKLDKDFGKDEIAAIAQQMAIPGTFKTKKAALEEIRRRIAGRKGSFERTQW